MELGNQSPMRRTRTLAGRKTLAFGAKRCRWDMGGNIRTAEEEEVEVVIILMMLALQ